MADPGPKTQGHPPIDVNMRRRNRMFLSPEPEDDVPNVFPLIPDQASTPGPLLDVLTTKTSITKEADPTKSGNPTSSETTSTSDANPIANKTAGSSNETLAADATIKDTASTSSDTVNDPSNLPSTSKETTNISEVPEQARPDSTTKTIDGTEQGTTQYSVPTEAAGNARAHDASIIGQAPTQTAAGVDAPKLSFMDFAPKSYITAAQPTLTPAPIAILSDNSRQVLVPGPTQIDVEDVTTVDDVELPAPQPAQSQLPKLQSSDPISDAPSNESLEDPRLWSATINNSDEGTSAVKDVDDDRMDVDDTESVVPEPVESMFVRDDETPLDDESDESSESASRDSISDSDDQDNGDIIDNGDLEEDVMMIDESSQVGIDLFGDGDDDLFGDGDLSEDNADSNNAVDQKANTLSVFEQSQVAGRPSIAPLPTGQKRKFGETDIGQATTASGSRNAEQGFSGRMPLSSSRPGLPRASPTNTAMPKSSNSTGRLPIPSGGLPMPSGGLPMPSRSIGQAAPASEPRADSSNFSLPMPTLIMPEDEEPKEPENVNSAQAAMLSLLMNKKKRAKVNRAAPEPRPLPSSLGEMPGDPSVTVATLSQGDRTTAGAQSSTDRAAVADDDVEMIDVSEGNGKSYAQELMDGIAFLRNKLIETDNLSVSEFAKLSKLEAELNAYHKLSKGKEPQPVQSNVEPSSERLERQKAYDEQNKEAEAIAEATAANPKRKHMKTSRQVHERNREIEAAKAAKHALKSQSASTGEDDETQSLGNPSFKNRMASTWNKTMDENVQKMVNNLIRSDAVIERMAQGENVTEANIKASTKEQQLKALLASVPEDLDSRQAKDEKAELNRASKSFGFGNIKAVDGKWLLKGMKTPMYHHQLLAANWLISKELAASPPHGGLLADAMGLGKTVSCLAAMVGNRPEANDPKPTLIVVPASMMNQWKKEIENHVHKETFPKVLVFNAASQISTTIIADCDIVITNYAAVMRSYRGPCTKEEKEEMKKIGPEEWNKKNSDSSGDLHQITWYRIVLDEAQAIKSHKSTTAQACFFLRGKFRTLLTGTPMQNNLEELYPYFRFMNCQYTKTFDEFKLRFSGNDYEPKRRLAVILMLYMKRRTNGDRILGKPLIVLPPIKSKLRLIKLTPQETVIYRLIEDRYREIVNEQLKDGEFQKNRGVYLSRIIRLRQAVSHTFLLEPLFKTLFDADALFYLRTKFKILNQNNTKAVYEEIKEWVRGREARQEFGQGDFGTRFNFKEFLNSPEQKDAAKRKKIICSICKDVPEKPFITGCSHIFCHDCIQDEMSKQNSDLESYECPRCQSIFDSIQEYKGAEADDVLLDGSNGIMSEGNAYHWRPNFQDSEWFKMCSKGGVELIPSAKTIAVKAQILRWQNEAPGDKILIFTQFLAMTKIIGMICQQEGWGHVYFTGKMTLKQRQASVAAFHQDKDVKIMIAVLKCGGVGLNLTAANRCINIDPWWNHHVEQQALGRIFRIGQRKTTHFVRIVAKDTVDMRMLDMQKDKMDLIEEALDKGNFNTRNLSIEEIANLFGRLDKDEKGNTVVLPDYAEASESEDEGDNSDEETGN